MQAAAAPLPPPNAPGDLKTTAAMGVIAMVEHLNVDKELWAATVAEIGDVQSLAELAMIPPVPYVTAIQDAKKGNGAVPNWLELGRLSSLW